MNSLSRGIRQVIPCLLIVAMLSMLLSFGEPPSQSVYASSTAQPTIKILEVTDTGASDLPVDSRYTIETMSMKRFVALRTELDGRYDAIYIGKGTYSPASFNHTTETRQDQRTKTVQNDITKLRANDITSLYINRGLPVILYYDTSRQTGPLFQPALTDGTRGNLYRTFAPYLNSSISNVIFVNNNNISSASNFLNKTNLLTRAAARPRLVVTSQPSSIQSGQTGTFTFNIANVSSLTNRKLKANLYLTVDSAISFGSDQLVATVPVTSLSNNTISYNFPSLYTSMYYWKLELVDETDGSKPIKDIELGSLNYRSIHIPQIRVLQVYGNDYAHSSLLNSLNLNQSYLTGQGYNITITAMPMGNTAGTTSNSFNNPNVYSKLNGSYDLIIFGFSDEYSKYAQISAPAAAAVQEFIRTGQGVMFTHDTIYGNASANWLSSFQALTGQIQPQSNVGLNGPGKTINLSRVNAGLMSQYPFNLSDTPQVAITHSQYYTLNLEDPTIIPWFNLSNNSNISSSSTDFRDDLTDSWNHFYTYSKGNVTYSGTGHPFKSNNAIEGNSRFPDWEQRLFVNTMYRAFIGSNHAPVLNVIAPLVNEVIPSVNPIQVSYQVDDYDVTDSKVTTSIAFKYNGTEQVVRGNTSVVKGQLINESFPNPLPNGGNLTIVITATDRQGAITTKEVPVVVNKISTDLILERTGPNGFAAKDSTLRFTYTIRPQSIPYSLSLSSSSLVIRNLDFKESLPTGVTVVGSNNLNNYRSSTSSSGSLVAEGKLPNISYYRSGDKYVANPITFTIDVKPANNGTYSFTQSTLTYQDFSSTNRSQSFPGLYYNVITRLTQLSLENTTILAGTTRRLLPSYLPVDASMTQFTWTSSNPDIVSVSETGNITAHQAGTARITAAATDGSGLRDTATVTVVAPTITGNHYVKLNTSSPYSIDYPAETANWSVTEGTGAANLNITGNTVTLTGTRSGTVTLHADFSGYRTSRTITIQNIEIQAAEAILKGQQTTIQAIVQPAPSGSGAYVWSVTPGTGTATLSSNSGSTVTITGTQPGTVVVKLTVNGMEVTRTITVYEISISGPDQLGNNGTPISYTAVINPNVTGSKSWAIKPGTGNGTISSNGNTATVTGTRAGSAELEFTFNGVSLSKPITIWEPRIMGAKTYIKRGDSIQLTSAITPSSISFPASSFQWRVNGGSPVSGSNITLNSSSIGALNVNLAVDGTSTATTLQVIDGSITGPNQVGKGQSIVLEAAINSAVVIPGSQLRWEVASGTGSATITPLTNGTVRLTGVADGTVTARLVVGDEVVFTKSISVVRVILSTSRPTVTLTAGRNNTNFMEYISVNAPFTIQEIKGKLSWTSSNPAVLTVTEQATPTLRAHKRGTSILTIMYDNDPATRVSIIVNVSSSSDRY